jgi:hypothetical protein
METLPDELLLHVFTFVDPHTLLTLVPGVCRRWRRLCGATPGLHMDMSFFDYDMGLFIHRKDATGARMMAELARRWRNAVGVSFYVGCTDILLAAMTAQCTKLTHFVSAFSGDITDVGVTSLAMHCPRLVSVCFRECDQLTDVGLVTLAEKCRQLVSVTATYGKIQSSSVTALAKHCPLLTSVNFTNCVRLTDVGALARCTQLTQVGFENCSLVVDADVILLAQHCVKLTNVDFSGCDELTDGAVVALAKHCPLLAIVRFDRCAALTDAGVIVLSAQCARLTVVGLCFCVLLTTTSALALAKNCLLLTSVDFCGCARLTDPAVVAFANHAQVRRANFTSCDELTNGAVVDMAVLLSKTPTSLWEVVFSDCYLISAEALTAMAKHCPQFQIVVAPSGYRV